MTGARRKRIIVFLLGVLSVLGLIITSGLPGLRESRLLDKRLCYLYPHPASSSAKQYQQNGSLPTAKYDQGHQQKQNDLLPDITEHPKQPIPGRSIFFHETSCAVDNEISLNSRQACAIESAAKNNPDRDIYVLFSSPRKAMREDASPYLQALATYKNVHFRNVNIWEYARGTLLEDWINENTLFMSDYVHFHMSDFMRYLSLNKYRGTYLDMDVVVLRSLDGKDMKNYAGAESWEDVAAGIITFDDSVLGRQLSELCVRDFIQNFSGQKWGNNGPGVITRVLNKVCDVAHTEYMTPQRCHGFNVLPPVMCYAVPYRQWNHFMDQKYAQEVLLALNRSVIAHFWNKFSIEKVVMVGDGSAYDVLAKKYCPVVYATLPGYF